MKKLIYGVMVVSVAVISASPAWAVLNNGFNTDWVYTLKSEFEDFPAVTTAENLRAYNKADADIVDPTRVWDAVSGSAWHTMTFAGTGTDDARLFVSRVNGTTSDIEISEVHSIGFLIGGITSLNALSGEIVGSTNPDTGTIRYSPFSNSLFVTGNKDDGSSTPAIVYEVDLDLTTVLNTYTGPNVLRRSINIAINDRDGTLYMTNRNLNNPTTPGGLTQGDLIAFDTSGGSTSSYTTLIEGFSLQNDGEPNHYRWNDPQALIYRKGATAADDTIVVAMNNSSSPRNPMEFYLDTTAHSVDVNGNLQFQNLLPKEIARGWNGQQQGGTGELILGNLRGGVAIFDPSVDDPDDVDGVVLVNPSRDFMDADAPIMPPESTPGDFNGDGVVDAADYTVWMDNLGLSEDGRLNGNGDGGTVAGSDYTLWTSNFPSGLGAVSRGGATTVPEPSGILLVSLAIAIMGEPRRRQV